MPRCVWRKGDGWIGGEPASKPIGAPMVIARMPEYRSPVTGKLISDPRQRRYDLESNNCREIDPSEKPFKGGPVNPKYCNHPDFDLEASKEFYRERAEKVPGRAACHANPYEDSQ